MIKVPGEKPYVPHINPKEATKDVAKTENSASKVTLPVTLPTDKAIGRGPEMDAHSIAVRLGTIAAEAKQKEISGDEFERILEEVIRLTGLNEPEAAMAEANRKLQKEIELELEKIKANKGLMDEAHDWQKFGDLLAQMNEDQINAFLGLLKESVRELN